MEADPITLTSDFIYGGSERKLTQKLLMNVRNYLYSTFSLYGKYICLG